MTYQENIKELSENKIVQKEIQAVLKLHNTVPYGREGSKMLLKAIEDTKGVVNTYLINYFHERRNSHNLVYADYLIVRDKGKKNLSEMGINKFTPFYQDLPDNIYKALMLKSDTYKESKRRVEEKFLNSAKNLKVNAFSYNIFKAWIERQKKITSADALRYIKELCKIKLNTNAEKEIYDKYIKLLWDYAPTKSISLSEYLKLIGATRIKNEAHIEYPFVEVTNIKNLQKAPITTKWNTQVAFAFNGIKTYARFNNIGLLSDSLYITERDVHDFITTVPKKNKLASFDVYFILDKIKIFEHLKLHNKNKCPYYNLASQQLIAELEDPRNKRAVQEVFKTLDSTIEQAEKNTFEIIKKIKGNI